nr:AAA family ATPase [Gemmatimonadota bacterium]
MPLVLAKSFLESYASLSQPVQKDVRRMLDKFDEMSRSQSLHLEPIKGSLDSNVRTIRVNQGVRGVVAAPEHGETFVLIDVLPHDDAINWCRRKRLSVNHATGALKVYDITEHAATMPSAPVAMTNSPVGFLSDLSDELLVQGGIDWFFVPAIRALTSEVDLEALAAKLPADQGQALIMLAAGYSVDEVLAELLAERPMLQSSVPFADDFVASDSAAVRSPDIAAAAQHPASAAAFYVVESAAALAELLNQPLEHWRVFLHPAQRRLAYRPTYEGPARVLGGPGTGKTVVALHRARYLAAQLPHSAGRRVLLTTFTRNLAAALERQLVSLAGDEPILACVDVLNIDALAYRIVQEAEGKRPPIVAGDALRAMLAEAADLAGLPYGPDFLRKEWEQVILGQGISTREAYFSASRAGRGIRLDRRQRSMVWAALETLTGWLAERGERTHLQIAQAATEHAVRRPGRYDHVIVDEAQDLHPAQWRLLRALVPKQPNDLFIVGDAHQRIYDNRVSLSALGISIRGRGTKLRLNYRTTYEILRWSIGLLSGIAYDDLDGSADDLQGYRSQLRGLQPFVMGFDTADVEHAALAQAIRDWASAGVPLREIGIAARTTEARRCVAKALSANGIATSELTSTD